MDQRRALAAGTELGFAGMTCVTEQEIGRGSNAIVYKGWYADSVTSGPKHHVLIKELFPYHEKAAVFRDPGGNGIRWLPEAQDTVDLHTQSFLWGNEIHLRLRECYPDQTGGNLNTCALNHTYYTLLDFSGGRSLDKELSAPNGEWTLRSLAQRMAGVLTSLQIFHESGYLHLDISLDNILLINGGGGERVELIDYNSVIRQSNVTADQNVHVSMKQGYTSPEMRLHALKDVGPWTDLYTVTAVFFRCLTGRALSRMEFSGVVPPDVSASPYLRDAPETVKRMTCQIIAKGLRTVARARYQSADEMLADLRELLDRIDGVGVTHWALWEAGSRGIHREIGNNPALSYLTSDETLFPAEIDRADGSGADALPLEKTKVVLTGSGGMGKTTALLCTAWRAGQKYREDKPVALYISLYGYREGDAGFIHNSILQRLRFKPVTGGYEDARHALDLLLQKPIRTRTGEAPVLCLLLDGYNEIFGDATALHQEIGRLAHMAAVGVVVASRNPIPELPFEEWRLKPLAPGTIQRILNEQGLLVPKQPQMQALLANAMMLSLFLRACKGAREQLSIQTREELIEAYLNALLAKEVRTLPDGSPERWQLEAAVRYVYPMVSGLETRMRRSVTGVELLSVVNALYALLKRRAFASLFPKWVGHAGDIRGGAKDGEAWYGLMIHRLLWRRLGLLHQEDNGTYRVVHQELREVMAARSKRVRSALDRQKVVKRAASGLVALAMLAAGSLAWPRQSPPYDAMKTLDALGYAQIVYTELNRQYAGMKGLLGNENPREDGFNRETFASCYGFDGARRALSGDNLRYAMDTDGDGEIERELTEFCEALSATGQRVPWGGLPFDRERFLDMAGLLTSRAQRYAGYVDMLETVYDRGTPEEYKHYGGLMAAALDADAGIAAAYDYLVYALRAEGMATWETTPEGRAYAGSFNRLDEGQGYCQECNAYMEEGWRSAGLERMISILNEAVDAGLEAQGALNRDTTYERLKRSYKGGWLV